MKSFLVFAFTALSLGAYAQQINLDPATTGQALVGQSAVSLPCGDPVVSGYNTNLGTDNAFIARHNTSGILWAKTLVDTVYYSPQIIDTVATTPVLDIDTIPEILAVASCRFEDLMLTANGELVAVGSYQQDGLVVRLDQDGNVLWTKVFGTIVDSNDTTEVFTGVCEDSDGNLVIVGTKRTVSSDRTQTVTKLDATGNLLWFKEVNRLVTGSGYYAESVIVKGDSILLFGSDMTSFGNYYDASILVFDQLGNQLGYTIIGSVSGEFMRDAVTYQNGFIFSYRLGNSQVLGLVYVDENLVMGTTTMFYGPSGSTINGGYLSTNGTDVYMTGQVVYTSPDPDLSYSFVSKINPTTLLPLWTKTVHQDGGVWGKGIFAGSNFQVLSFRNNTNLGSSTGSIMTTVTSTGLILGGCNPGGSIGINLLAFPIFGFIQSFGTGTTSAVSVNQTTKSLVTYTPRYTPCVVLLPVELVSFEAEKEEENALISWRTASERESSHFNIQRSKDGYTFENIGEVSSTGNSQQVRSYSFVDEHPLSGMNYYRLESVDLDGSNDFSDVVPLEFEGRKESYVVYPNPAISGEAVSIKGEFQSAIAFDQLGQEVRTQRNGNQVTIDAPPGVYLLTLVSPDGAYETVRVVMN